MKIKNIAIVILCISFLVAFFQLLPEPKVNSTVEKSKSTVSENFIIRNVDLYDGNRWHNNVDVEVFEQKVSQIGISIENSKKLDELDANDQYLIPGLIDAHTHTWGNALKEALNFGVMTELDMFTMPDFTKAHKALRGQLNNTGQADLFSATILATAPNGHGTEYGFEIPVLDNIEQVAGFVNDRVKDGADYIKAVYTSAKSQRKHFPSISLAILKALAVEAKKHHKLLVVHVDDLISAKEAIQVGANGLVHSFMDKLADDELVKLMQTNNAFMIATLQVEASITQLGQGKKLIDDPLVKPYLSTQQLGQLKASFMNFGIPKTALKNAQKSVKILHDNGITILAGSDAPNPGTTHGASLHEELVMLVESGLSNEQALYAATGAVNKAFGLRDSGLIKIGAPASMILLKNDPRVDINHSKQISALWKNGVHFKRVVNAIKSNNDTAIKAGEIAEFNNITDNQQQIKTKIGTGIAPSSDQFAGGKSVVNFSAYSLEDNNELNALKVSGKIKQGFAYTWSGLAFIPGKSFNEGANLSQVKSLKFKALDLINTKNLSIMLFQQGSFQPVTKNISISEQWASYKVSLKDFNGIDLTTVSNISIVATGSPREFSFAISDLAFE